MKRLRHPIRAIREPFGTAGLVVACVALIAALGGTALAAAKLNSTQKKEVEKIAKKYAGKPGAQGAQGPAGPAGGAGKDGSNGTNGTNGTDGEDGIDGAPGKSVVVKAVTPGEEGELEECEERGGSEVEVEGAGGAEAEICNGKDGSPWTVGNVLPPGAVETGTFAFHGSAAENPSVNAALSLSIPLAAPILREHIHIFPVDSDFEQFCIQGAYGGSRKMPNAPPGEMCIWAGDLLNSSVNSIAAGNSGPDEEEELGNTGGYIYATIEGTEFGRGSGTFAVRGCAGTTGTNACP
jgi:hypothetical protein